MSTPKKAEIESTDNDLELPGRWDTDARPEVAKIESASDDSAYASLLGELRRLEKKYKLGDVDDEVKDSTTGKTTWVFEEELCKAERLVLEHQERLLKENPSWYYKFIAIRAEAKEYFGTATPSYRLDLYQLAQRLHRELLKRKEVPADPDGVESEERKTLKNVIRVIVAGLEHLHGTSEFGTAIAYARELYDFVNNSGLATKDNPAYGTKSVVCYFLGRTHRQRGIDDDYRLAIDYFYQCSENYFELARQRESKNEVESPLRPESKNEDVIYARTRAMVSLAFGAGFLYHNALSDLARAKGLIAQARLAFIKDDGGTCCQLHYNYLELLYASILREEAGELEPGREEEGPDEAAKRGAKEKLNRALNILNRCEKTLARKPSYYIRFLYNKALVYMYQGPDRYGDALDCVTRLLDICQESPRWLANGLVLKSRLERRLGDAEAALADALSAFNQAGSHLPMRVEALLARGKAQQDRGNLAGARADFEKAAQLNNGANRRLDVLSLILLAQVAIAQQQPQVALEKFAQAQEHIPSINHGFILNRYRALEAQITNFHADFIIPSGTSDLTYEGHEKALRCWLLEKALREDNNLTRVAQRLGVSKKTVYQWRDAYGIKA